MKNIEKITYCLIACVFLISITAMAQPNNPEPPGVPIDGGIVALVAAGAAYGYRTYRKRNELK